MLSTRLLTTADFIAGQGKLIIAGGTPGLIDPISNPQAYDFITVAGARSPGIIPPGGITGFGRKSGWQQKSGRGTKGATLTYTNSPPTKGSIEFLLWTSGHFGQWDDFVDNFLYDPTKTPDQNALQIYHPTLHLLNVSAVVCDTIWPPRNAGKGKWSIKVDLIEWIPSPSISVVGTVDHAEYSGGSAVFHNQNTADATVDGNTATFHGAAQQPTANSKNKQGISQLLVSMQKAAANQ